MTVMTQVDPFHLRPFFWARPKGSEMTRKSIGLFRIAERATVLDVVHLAAIISCSAWTANLIVKDRFGSVQTAAVQILHGLQATPESPRLTIRLDEVVISPAR
jgi:hypothetical protein